MELEYETRTAATCYQVSSGGVATLSWEYAELWYIEAYQRRA